MAYPIESREALREGIQMDSIIQRGDIEASGPNYVCLAAAAIGLLAFFLPLVSDTTSLASLIAAMGFTPEMTEVTKLFGFSLQGLMAACIGQGIILAALPLLLFVLMPVVTAIAAFKNSLVQLLILAFPLVVVLLMPPMLIMMAGRLGTIEIASAGPGYWALWISYVLLFIGSMITLMNLIKHKKAQTVQDSPLHE